MRLLDDGTISSVITESAGPYESSKALSLRSLPPLLLTLTLPQDYPLRRPPRLLGIHATSSWLPHIVRVQEELLTMWQAPDTVLCEWVEWIHGADFLSSLGFLEADGAIRYDCFHRTSRQSSCSGQFSAYPIQLPSYWRLYSLTTIQWRRPCAFHRMHMNAVYA